MKPLAGIRVLDMSRVLAGPFATQTLADLGAAVVKIERPGAGDDTRHWGPPFAQDRTGARGDAAYFFSANRGKRSLSVDFTRAAGRQIVRRLVDRSDVLVENFKVGGLAPYGLDAGTLRQRNPRLIYCSITGFGQSGPYAARPGYDASIQALGGLMSITGEPDGTPGGGPQKVGVAVVDVMTGVYAASAILAALFERQRSGEGTHIDLSLLDVQVAMLANQASNWLVGGTLPERMGSAHPSIVPYQPFECADGHVMIAIGNDSQFAAFCRALEQPSLARDERYATNPARVENRTVLIDVLRPLMRARTLNEWMALAERHGFACSPINTIDRVFADPHVQARGLVAQLDSPRYGPVKTVVSPLRFDGEAACADSPPPQLAEANAELLAELGYTTDDVARLRDEGVI